MRPQNLPSLRLSSWLSLPFLRRWLASLLVASALISTYLALYKSSRSPTALRPSNLYRHRHKHPLPVGSQDAPSKELVVAAVAADDISWVASELPDWSRSVYVIDRSWWTDLRWHWRVGSQGRADDNEGGLRVPVNKGHEGMAYLTYILDNYDDLPEVMVFIHGRRWQWHVDDPGWDSIPTLRSLQLNNLRKAGYMNLRCHWEHNACPPAIHTDPATRPPVPKGLTPNHAEQAYVWAWSLLFPGETVPAEVGAACCAQFVVTRERVRARSIEDYKRYRDWLSQTPVQDSITGRVLEFTWHIIFGMPAVTCPTAKECYCNVYGYCNLTCSEPGSCEGRYSRPDVQKNPGIW